MRTALAFWRRSQVSASTSTHVFHRPDKINWIHVAIKMGQTQERPGTGPGRRRESCGEWAIYGTVGLTL